jgi:uncharacterized phage infection (PIP) family protein YhgE
MSEEQRPPSSSGARSPKDASDLVDELREMGQQLEAVFRAAVESERTKQLQRDLAGGVREITAQVQTALKSLQTNPRVQQAEERGRDVFNQAQRSKVVQDVQETVVTGLSQLNDQLRKVVDRLEHERSSSTSSTPTQRVHVETETPSSTVEPNRPPTTGETTKLDE